MVIGGQAVQLCVRHRRAGWDNGRSGARVHFDPELLGQERNVRRQHVELLHEADEVGVQ